MREFLYYTPRPWHRRLTVIRNAEETIGSTYLAEDAELIVHAVNTYEERERLLEEAAEAIRNLCSAIDIEADISRFSSRYPNTMASARAFLAKLEARDA